MTKRKKSKPKPTERWFTWKGSISTNGHRNGTHGTWRMTSERVGRFWDNGRDREKAEPTMSSLANDPNTIELNPATGQPFSHKPKPIDWQARALAAEKKLAQIKGVCGG